MTGFEASEDVAGARLDVAVAQRLACSRSRAAARIAAGEVLVDGRQVGKNHRLAVGQRVEVVDVDEPAERPPSPPLPPVRYEDADLLVIAKPAGLVVHPGHGRSHGTLVDALRAAHVALPDVGDPQRPGIVHRLDRDTSGLLVVAKTDRAYEALVQALRRREVERGYLALVDRVPDRERARIEAPIGRDPRDRVRYAVVATGRFAATGYRVLAVGRSPAPDGAADDVALLSCRLETGRTHQIRVHLSSLGHPVTGDRTYRADVRLSRALGLERPFLHAASLTLAHPVTGEPVRLTEPLPTDLRAAARAAGVAEALPES